MISLRFDYNRPGVCTCRVRLRISRELRLSTSPNREAFQTDCEAFQTDREAFQTDCGFKNFRGKPQSAPNVISKFFGAVSEKSLAHNVVCSIGGIPHD